MTPDTAPGDGRPADRPAIGDQPAGPGTGDNGFGPPAPGSGDLTAGDSAAADGSGPADGSRSADGSGPAAADGSAADPGPGEPGEPGGEGYEPSGKGRRRKGAKQRSFWKELPILIGVALVLALLIKTFLVQAFSIPSDSMQDTLQRGDRVLVDKLTPWFGSSPERGEVVVFKDPGGWLPPPVDNGGLWSEVQKGLSFVGLMPSAEDQNLIKRVIAVGGDTVECQIGGQVTVNGTPVEESDVIYPGTPGDPNDPANTACDDKPFGPLEVPDGRLWVMGDHRQDSQDSRYHMNSEGGGTVSEDEVVGRAVVVAWPINRWSFLSVPGGYSTMDSALASAAPAALGLAGALPLVLWRRRVLLRR